MAVSHAEFKPFPKELLTDNAKMAEKGVLLVDLQDSQGEIATVALTHAQHSDQVRHGSEAEKKARTEEMQFIMQSLSSKTAFVLTGDLNMDDAEMQEPSNVSLYSLFTKVSQYLDSKGAELFTWGGDEWYVKFGNKTADYAIVPAGSSRSEPRKASTGCNLDHTMVSKATLAVTTTLVEDPISYDPTKISRESLSDHLGLRSYITKLSSGG